MTLEGRVVASPKKSRYQWAGARISIVNAVKVGA
jgi:hypothetical protein